MAHRFKLNIPAQRMPGGSWDPEQRLAQALRQREIFLEKKPQYRKLQHEIDQLLEKAGTSENRMAVLAILMEGKMIELHSQLQRLSRIFQDVSGAKRDLLPR
jgi:hypothetical protein